MRQIEITLPADIAHTLEIRAAIDDLRLSEGIAQLLEEIVRQWRDR